MRLSTGAPGQVIGNNRYGIASGQKLGKHSMSTPRFQVISATIISPRCELSCPMSDGLPPFKACAARSKIHPWYDAARYDASSLNFQNLEISEHNL